ncbi:MAG: Dabb family protein [Bacteroidia bacterium]|nr:Dabb family protein [Bacteroidia bacterium]
MVIFDLKHEKGSEAEAKFLADGKRILTHIPVVRDFRVLDQVSLKNDYHFGFSMHFDNRKDYGTYNNHPDHMAFVENRWKKEVTRFLEIDFKEH